MPEPQQVSGAEEPPKNVDVHEIWQQGYKAGWYDHAMEVTGAVSRGGLGLPVHEAPVIATRGQRAASDVKPRSRAQALLALLPRISEWRPWRAVLYVALLLGGIWFLDDIVFEGGELTKGIAAVWQYWISPDVAIVAPGMMGGSGA
jgi:hypothetical protein